MKRKHFKTPIDRDLEVPLSQYNINELLPCLENIEASVLGVTASHAEASDSKEEFDINNLVVGYDLCAHANYDCDQCKAICVWRVSTHST